MRVSVFGKHYSFHSKHDTVGCGAYSSQFSLLIPRSSEKHDYTLKVGQLPNFKLIATNAYEKNSANFQVSQ